MFEFLYRSDYIKAKQENDFCFLGHVDIPIPTWNFVLKCFDLSLQEEVKLQKQKSKHMMLRSFDNFGFILHKIPHDELITQIKDAIEFSHFDVRKNKQIFSAYAFVSLSAISKTFGMHTDTMDVWCWQVTGETLFTVLGKKGKFEKILTPGEMIYVPRGMEHDTKPIGPRAIISFGLEDAQQ